MLVLPFYFKIPSKLYLFLRVYFLNLEAPLSQMFQKGPSYNVLNKPLKNIRFGLAFMR